MTPEITASLASGVLFAGNDGVIVAEFVDYQPGFGCTSIQIIRSGT